MLCDGWSMGHCPFPEFKQLSVMCQSLIPTLCITMEAEIICQQSLQGMISKKKNVGRTHSALCNSLIQ